MIGLDHVTKWYQHLQLPTSFGHIPFSVTFESSLSTLYEQIAFLTVEIADAVNVLVKSI